jgi:hypothetical protein
LLRFSNHHTMPTATTIRMTQKNVSMANPSVRRQGVLPPTLRRVPNAV